MAEPGRSRRPEHLLTFRAEINQPGKATMANLVTAINAWEANKGYLTRITGKRMDEEDERLILIQMCPEALEAYLRKDSTKSPTYHDVKYEIFDYIARTATKKRSGALNEVSRYTPPGLYEPEWDQNLQDNWQEEEHFEGHYDQRELSPRS